MKYRILAVDDDPLTLDANRVLLEEHEFELDTAQSSDEALERVRRLGEGYAAILVDYHMPKDRLNGAQLVREILSLSPEASIFIYSGDGSAEAMKATWAAGAAGFIQKDVDDNLVQRLRAVCRRYDETTRPLAVLPPESENEKLIASLGLVGRSSALAEVVRRVQRFHDSQETVIVYGNTGVGKELVARALHSDPKKPFLVVNCAAFRQAHLLESELFGYEKGAFTGADRAKIGILEAAQGGTVFLDEIHQLSLEAQSKLLRVTQEKRIRRVGGHHEYPVQFRLIVAAQPALQEMVKKKEFLSDLFFRVNKLPIVVPDLKDRKEDIEPLVAHFTEKYRISEGVRAVFRMKTVRFLERYDWPGNVRELDNTVYQLLKNCLGKYVEPHHLDPRFFVESIQSSRWEDLERRHQEERRKLLASALERAQSKAHAAEILGIQPTTLHSLRIKHGLYQPGQESGKREAGAS